LQTNDPPHWLGSQFIVASIAGTEISPPGAAARSEEAGGLLSRPGIVATEPVEVSTIAADGSSSGAMRVELPPSEERGGATAVKISNLVVQLFRTHTGRGPTKSRTSIESNLITVVLRDTLTNGERNLVAEGQAELVVRLRRAYQEIMHDDLIAGVEELTQRKVSALLSDNHIDPDVAVEVFVLEPVS
jgi:uncharacterized protein YbcI